MRETYRVKTRAVYFPHPGVGTLPLDAKRGADKPFNCCGWGEDMTIDAGDPKLDGRPKFGKWLGPALLVVLGLVTLRGCISCSQFVANQPDAAPPVAGDALRKLSLINSVEINDVNVIITSKISCPLPAACLQGAGSALRQIAKAIQQHPETLPASEEGLILLIQTPLVDRLGNSHDEKILNLSYKIADLKAFNLGSPSEERMLDLAVEARASNAAGQEVADDYCKDFAEFTPELCRQLSS
jgi:hypothetical protein